MAAHRFIESLLDGRPLTVYGDGRQVRDFTYVDDIVEATVRALFAEVPSGAVLDVASSQPTSVNTLVAHLEALVGSAATLDETDERPGDVPRTEGDIDSARDQLGWKPTIDLRTGLQRQLDWHRSLRLDAAMAGVSR
jgi:nucleoside-diphosphate-sugar epimerase